MDSSNTANIRRATIKAVFLVLVKILKSDAIPRCNSQRIERSEVRTLEGK